MRASLLGLAVLGFGCSNPLADVPPGTARTPPEQAPVEASAFMLEREGLSAKLKPRATYRADAVVLITDDSMDDAWSAVADLDVTLGWGPMANGALLKKLDFHLRRRYVSVRWGGDFPLGSDDVMHNLSNHHLIAADEEVREVLQALRPGDHVELEGQLVDLSVGGQTMRTSLSRTDKGNGACEVLYVQRAQRFSRS